MCVLEGVAHLGSDADRLVHGERPVARQPILQRIPLHVLHHVEEQLVRFVGFEEGDDVGVGKLRREEDFALEAPAPQVVASRRRQHFDGHAPAELHVGGEVDGRHAALAQLTYEGVAPREGTGQAVEQRVGGHG